MLYGSVLCLHEKVTFVFLFFSPPFLKRYRWTPFFNYCKKKKKSKWFSNDITQASAREYWTTKTFLTNHCPRYVKISQWPVKIPWRNEESRSATEFLASGWSAPASSAISPYFSSAVSFSKQKNVKYQLLNRYWTRSTQENLESQEWFNIKISDARKNFSLKKWFIGQVWCSLSFKKSDTGIETRAKIYNGNSVVVPNYVFKSPSFSTTTLASGAKAFLLFY